MNTPTDEQLKSTAKNQPLAKRMPDDKLKHGGGLQNMAEMMSRGYTIESYMMSSKTRAEIDAWIAAHPDRNPPFSAAPTEIDESVESVLVRLKEPDFDAMDNDQVLAKMKALVEPLPKPKAGDISKATGEMYEPK